MPTSICPECEEKVFVDAESEQGDRVSCEECHTNLVVVGLDPVELDVYEPSESDDHSERDDFDAHDDDRY